MNSRLRRLPLAALLVLAASCGGWREGGGGRSDAVTSSQGATVIDGDELGRTHGSLLRAMLGKVPNMKVNFTGLQRCPAIALRRAEDINGKNFPDVYVDGTRANNTCILESLQAQDAALVEIYPMGFTRRPGYGTSGQGLILVFLRSR